MLRNFVYKVCHGLQTPLHTFEEFFDVTGILKKYKQHPYVKKYLSTIKLDDELFHKAVNFALAITEKEHDDLTQKVSKLLLHYIVLVYQEPITSDLFKQYKNKIRILFDALSHNKYDTNLFEI